MHSTCVYVYVYMYVYRTGYDNNSNKIMVVYYWGRSRLVFVKKVLGLFVEGVYIQKLQHKPVT